jgi:hypothetical protein
LLNLCILQFNSEWEFLKHQNTKLSPRYQVGLVKRLSQLSSARDVESKFLNVILPSKEEYVNDMALFVFEIVKFLTENKGLDLNSASELTLFKDLFISSCENLMKKLWDEGISKEKLAVFLEDLMANRYGLSRSFRSRMEVARTTKMRDPRNVYGKFCEALFSASKLWNDPKQYVYSPYFPLLGPSMCGKSYLLQQVSMTKCSFFLYTCFRSERSSGIPAATHYFQALFQPSEDLDSEIYYRQVLLEILRYLANMEDPSSTKVADFNKMWINNDKVKLKVVHDIIEKNLEKSSFSKHGNLSIATKRKEKNEDQSRDMLQIWTQFESKWSGILDKSMPGLVLAFDEASRLLRSTSADENVETFFVELRRALRIFPQSGPATGSMPPVAVFTDTTATIADYCPAPAADGSLRVVKKQYFLLPPFYRMAFVDVYADKADVTLSSLDDFNRLLKYGRPFWGGVNEAIPAER